MVLSLWREFMNQGVGGFCLMSLDLSGACLSSKVVNVW